MPNCSRNACRSVAVALTAAMTLLSASAVNAADPEIQVRVPRSDLDIASEEGARVFLARLNRAARDVCGFSYVPGSARIDNANCRLRAVRSGLTQVIENGSPVHPLLRRRLSQVTR